MAYLIQLTHNFSLRRSAPYIAGLVLIGVVVIVSIRAAGAPAAFEAETGQIAGAACAIDKTGASGGKTAQFGNCPATNDGTTAAAKYGWGTPHKIEDFNDPALPDWFQYESPDTPWGYYGRSRISVQNSLLTLSGQPTGLNAGIGMTGAQNNQKYGKWEVRQKVAGDATCWRPVMLLWPVTERWPDDGEVDFAENAGNNLGEIHFNFHFGAQNNQTFGQAQVDMRQWNNYAVEWTPTYIKGYVNGVEFFSDSDVSHLPPQPMHIAIQLDGTEESNKACNGNTQQIVDWVKIYK